MLENPNDVMKLTMKKEKRKTPQKLKRNSASNKRDSVDNSDIYEFHDSPNDGNYSVMSTKPPPTKRRHTTSLTNKSFTKKVNANSKFKRKSVIPQTNKVQNKQLDTSKHNSSGMHVLTDEECLTTDNGFTFGYKAHKI